MKWKDFLEQISTQCVLADEGRETLLTWLPQENLEISTNKLKDDLKITEDALKKRRQKIYEQFSEIKKLDLGLGSKKAKNLRKYLRQEFQNIENKSPEEKLADLLCSLDYKQEQDFEECLVRLGYTGAFLVRGDQLIVQMWLAKRLALKAAVTQGERPVAVFIPTTIIPANPMTWNLDAFWSNICQQLQIPESCVSDKYIEKRIQENRMNFLTNLNQKDLKMPTVLSMHGFDELKPVVKEDFWKVWCEFADAFYKKKKNRDYIRGRFVILLLDNCSANPSADPCPIPRTCLSQAQDFKSLIELEPLQTIPQNDLSHWLSNKAYDLLAQPPRSERSANNTIANNDLWEPTPSATIEKICSALLNGRTTSVLEPYWKSL